MLNKLKLILLSLASLCLVQVGNTQSYDELALLFSQTKTTGSARVMGFGGAQVALGGDASLSLSNPAGLGMANRSSFSGSLGILSNSNDATYYGNLANDGKLNINIPQMGLIFHTPSNEGGRYKGGSFSVNVSRINSFQDNVTYSGNPTDHSIIDYMLGVVDGQDPNTFQSGGAEYNSITGLGWFTYLIDTIYNDTDQALYYDSYVTEFPVSQSEIIEISGSQNSWNFAYGGNFDDIFFFGGGVGIVNLNYQSRKSLTEIFPGNTLNSITADEFLVVRGNGINANFGVIVRPVSLFQVGLSYTTRTIYNINDSWDAEMTTQWGGYNYPGVGSLNTVTESSAILVTDYRLRTPSKLSAGAAIFLGKYGFISADVDRLNYGKNRLSSRDFSMDPENSFIDENFGTATNFRLGAEIRLDKFRIRGGTAYYQDPRLESDGLGASTLVVTGGFGVRRKNSYFDIALVNSQQNYEYSPYRLTNPANLPASIERRNFVTQLTYGFVF